MKKGFTLIELLVVVLIIGILASVALPQYNKAVLHTRYATLKKLTHSIAAAQEVYYLKNNEYSTDFENLDIQMPGGKKSNSVASKYYYNWGNCWITSGNAFIVTCRNTLSNLEYGINLEQSGVLPGTRKCVARGSSDLNSLQAKICKAETGQAAPENVVAGDSSTWRYKD